jgi:hypothetical protein
MQAPILNKFKQPNATLNRDRSCDLFIIGLCEAFNHEFHLVIINLISILIAV